MVFDRIHNATDNVTWTAQKFAELADRLLTVLKSGKVKGRFFCDVKEGPPLDSFADILRALNEGRLAIGVEIDIPQPERTSG